MSSHIGSIPGGRDADRRWKHLDRKRRSALLRGAQPADGEEAVTALGYGRRMRTRAELFALVGAMGAFVVYLAIALLMEGETTRETFILAGGVAVGVGLALEIIGRRRGRRLEQNAKEALDDD